MTVDVEAMVRKFMVKHSQFKKRMPSQATNEVAVLRLRLMMEELGEIATAIHKVQALPLLVDRDQFFEAMAELADGLADLVYVVVGTAIAYGIPFNEVFAEVQRSNMTKGVLDRTQKGGKVGKGSKFEPPQIREILEEKFPDSL